MRIDPVTGMCEHNCNLSPKHAWNDEGCFGMMVPRTAALRAQSRSSPFQPCVPLTQIGVNLSADPHRRLFPLATKRELPLATIPSRST